MGKIVLKMEMEEEDWNELCARMRLEGRTTRDKLDAFKGKLYRQILKKDPPLTSREKQKAKREEEKLKKLQEKMAAINSDAHHYEDDNSYITESGAHIKDAPLPDLY